ncbi:MAG: glutathione peroxidase [Pseudomonadota bacterium]
MLRLLAFGLALVLAGLPARGGERVHDLAFAAIDGTSLDLAAFEGRPLLVVNTASRCGFTPQYASLQEVWERYRDRGLVVIGMPSNDFNQEYGDDAAIRDFCEVNFGIDFPMSASAATRGSGQHPFFARVAEDLGAGALPRWNFHKYLVDRAGRVVAGWPSMTRPTGAEITAAIEAALAEPAG